MSLKSQSSTPSAPQLYNPGDIRTGNFLPLRSSDLSFEGEISLTKQSFSAECDINNIMKQWEKTGLIPHVNTYGGQYADLGDAADYHSSLNVVLAAQAAFDSLPAQIRSRFGNDPAAFLDFVNNADNLPEMEKMGLLKEDLSQIRENALRAASTEAATLTAEDAAAVRELLKTSKKERSKPQSE